MLNRTLISNAGFRLFRLAFPDVLNNYFRMLLHHVGDFYELDHPIDTHQTGKKAITFYKKREFRQFPAYPMPFVRPGSSEEIVEKSLLCGVQTLQSARCSGGLRWTHVRESIAECSIS